MYDLLLSIEMPLKDNYISKKSNNVMWGYNIRIIGYTKTGAERGELKQKYAIRRLSY